MYTNITTKKNNSQKLISFSYFIYNSIFLLWLNRSKCRLLIVWWHKCVIVSGVFHTYNQTNARTHARTNKCPYLFCADVEWKKKAQKGHWKQTPREMYRPITSACTHHVPSISLSPHFTPHNQSTNCSNHQHETKLYIFQYICTDTNEMEQYHLPMISLPVPKYT